MEDPKENQETGKRVGIHPMIVLFGVIFGLWIFTQAIIPKSKNIQPPQGPGSKAAESQLLEDANSALEHVSWPPHRGQWGNKILLAHGHRSLGFEPHPLRHRWPWNMFEGTIQLIAMREWPLNKPLWVLEKKPPGSIHNAIKLCFNKRLTGKNIVLLWWGGLTNTRSRSIHQSDLLWFAWVLLVQSPSKTQGEGKDGKANR